MWCVGCALSYRGRKNVGKFRCSARLGFQRGPIFSLMQTTLQLLPDPSILSTHVLTVYTGSLFVSSIISTHTRCAHVHTHVCHFSRVDKDSVVRSAGVGVGGGSTTATTATSGHPVRPSLSGTNTQGPTNTGVTLVNTDSDSDDEQEPEPLGGCCKMWHKTTHSLHKSVSKGFAAHARRVAQRPCLVIAVSLLVCMGLSCGLLLLSPVSGALRGVFVSICGAIFRECVVGSGS